jgi:hypothetical protein
MGKLDLVEYQNVNTKNFFYTFLFVWRIWSLVLQKLFL